MRTTRISAVLLIASLLVLSACDTTTSGPEISEEEAEAVADVMAEALSDRSDGMMAGLHDLTATVSRTGLSYRGTEKRHIERDWRGPHRGFAATYDSTTGEHLIQYRREIDRPHLFKRLTVHLSYIFEDVNGTFLQFPRRQSDAIATITFDGRRTGDTRITRRRGTFASAVERDAQWMLDGLEEGSPTMTLNGTQTHAGRQRVSRGDTVRTRDYSLRLNVVDVSIRKPTGDDRPLEERISGTLEYQATVTHTVNGEEETNSYRGTVELGGPGSARLRLMGFRTPFIINLINGDVQRAA